MVDFLIRDWILSILIGVLMGLVTKTVIKTYDQKKLQGKISNANKMIINHLRSYVVGIGLPPIEIINAIKASVARECNVSYDKLFTTKSLCEELIKDIIGNSYISTCDQKKYGDMLIEYLKQGDILVNDNKEVFIDNTSKLAERTYAMISNIISIIAGIVTIISVFLTI